MAALSQELVRFVLKRREQGLPPEIREKARYHILDTVGISLAARAGTDVAQQAVAGARYGGARGDCSVWGGGEGLPPAMAAFANSACAHTLDYDDIHDMARTHPSAVCVPAALAAAELVNASGRSVVDAVALGNELMVRLGKVLRPSASGPGSEWFLSQFHGYFGAAVAAGLVMGLSEDELVSALGFGYMQQAGAKEAAFGVGGNARSIYTAFAAMGGVHAALLARGGVTGPISVMDGRANLYKVFLDTELTESQRAELLREEGWAFSDVEIKPYPSCRFSHPYVATTLAAREEMAPTDVERVLVRVNPSNGRLCKPLDARRKPATLQDAKFSIPYMVAFTLVKGRVSLQNLDREALGDPEVLSVTEKMEVSEELPDGPGVPPGDVTLISRGGKEVRSRLAPPHLSPEQVEAKFMDCCAYAGVGVAAEKLRDRLLGLEEIPIAGLFVEVKV